MLSHNLFYNLSSIQIYNHQPVLKFPWNHFYIPYILSVVFSTSTKSIFVSHSPVPQVIILLSALQNQLLTTHSSFSSQNFCDFLLHFFSQCHSCHVHLQHSSTFPHMFIEITQRNSPFYHKNELPLHLVFCLVAHSHILFASLLYLKLAQLLLLCRFFFQLPHSFHLFSLSPKFQLLQIPHHFLTTTVYTFIPKCTHKTSFLALPSYFLHASHINSSLPRFFTHTSVFLPQRLPTFKVPNLIPQHSGLNLEILCISCPFMSCRRLGAICLFFLVMGICLSKIILHGACPCFSFLA